MMITVLLAAAAGVGDNIPLRILGIFPTPGLISAVILTNNRTFSPIFVPHTSNQNPSKHTFSSKPPKFVSNALLFE